MKQKTADLSFASLLFDNLPRDGVKSIHRDLYFTPGIGLGQRGPRNRKSILESSSHAIQADFDFHRLQRRVPISVDYGRGRGPLWSAEVKNRELRMRIRRFAKEVKHVVFSVYWLTCQERQKKCLLPSWKRTVPHCLIV